MSEYLFPVVAAGGVHVALDSMRRHPDVARVQEHAIGAIVGMTDDAPGATFALQL